LAGSAKQYDRSHPGRPIFRRLFPDGRPSTITDASFTKVLSKAEGLLVHLQSLAEDNSLHTHEDVLTNAIKALRQAILNHKEVVLAESLAIAEEQMLQAELRKQYEFNYLDATKLFGKNYANRLFPKLAIKKKKLVEEVAVEA
uniref:hypothetical protein n=1 Tax=Ancylomarina sp. TaxID=1970196 RepID=UPI0035658F44